MSRIAIFTSICLATGATVEKRDSAPCSAPSPGAGSRASRSPTSGRGPAMDTIAPAMPVLPAELRHRRVRLELGQAAAAHACGHVRSAIVAWSVPVNPAVAILLTSDLVINAVTNGAGETITLGIRWSSGQFRVEVHDASVTGDSWETAEADADAERGLQLAAAMAAECGHYRTPAGRAVYYVLPLEQRAAATQGDVPPPPSNALPSNVPSAVPGRPDQGAREDSFRVGYPELAPRGAASGGGEP